MCIRARAGTRQRAEDMIVNKTAYTEEDMAFIYRSIPDKKKPDLYRIVSLLIDVFMIYWGIHCFLMFGEYDRQYVPVWFLIFIALLIILPVCSIWKAVKRAMERKKSSRNKNAERLKRCSEERTFTFGDSTADVSYVSDGVEYIKKYGYDKLTKLYVGDDRIYAVMRTNNNDIYMPVHDDGYTEGSKEELIAFLEKHGVKGEKI